MIQQILILSCSTVTETDTQAQRHDHTIAHSRIKAGTTGLGCRKVSHYEGSELRGVIGDAETGNQRVTTVVVTKLKFFNHDPCTVDQSYRVVKLNSISNP